MVEYQDRLGRCDTTDELLDEVEEIIGDMVGELFQQYYDGDVCGACLRDLPIKSKWGPMSENFRELEKLTEVTEQRVEEFGEDSDWVTPRIRGLHSDYYYTEIIVDPNECAVCTAELVAEDTPCGHWEMNQTCPVRGELP